MIYLVVVALVVVAISAGWYIYAKMLESKRMLRFARKRARDAAAWQKVLDKNAADRATADIIASTA